MATVKDWLGTWQGIGLVTAGMARQGHDLALTRYDGESWRATFFVTGREHSLTSSVGSAWEETPWGAVLRAAWGALTGGRR